MLKSQQSSYSLKRGITKERNAEMPKAKELSEIYHSRKLLQNAKSSKRSDFLILCCSRVLVIGCRRIKRNARGDVNIFYDIIFNDIILCDITLKISIKHILLARTVRIVEWVVKYIAS